MNEAEARAAIVATAQAMERAGLAPNRSGNVSCRFDGGLLITPSGVPYAEMCAADIVALDLAGVVRSGTRTPSSESPFHTAIYRARPDAEAIVHTHSPQATALACTRRGIPAVSLHDRARGRSRHSLRGVRHVRNAGVGRERVASAWKDARRYCWPITVSSRLALTSRPRTRSRAKLRIWPGSICGCWRRDWSR